MSAVGAPRLGMQYLALMVNNASAPSTDDQWAAFFAQASESGIFAGGSALGDSSVLGPQVGSADDVVGFMRFEAEQRQQVEDLLQLHPVVVNGGSIRIYECPVS